jgi:methylated-DNA-protein-cysteine methyltransferase-like protein
MTEFQEAVARTVRLIPSGKLMSYGQIAVYVGVPRGARIVGWLMRSMETKVDIP